MSEGKAVVIDTNIVLDLFLFADPRTDGLKAQLESGQLQWQATQHMRHELERVLAYAHITRLLGSRGKQAEHILQEFDRYAERVAAPTEKAPYTCKDSDDQPFIDLACSLARADASSQVLLLSKDKAILTMRKRLEKLSVLVRLTV
jgi:predicted nucleic acid-binding protein